MNQVGNDEPGPASEFDIVAIAASAGGLQGSHPVLGELPKSFGVPVLVVQHLDPRYETVLADILARRELVHFVRPSADLLFESVAGSYGPRAIACVLTGAGSDGAMGVSAVKARGGTVLVQDPAIDQAQAERRILRASAVERRSVPGDVQYFDVLIQPVSRPDGMIGGLAVTFSDTTVANRLQHEVKQVKVDLETAYEELQSTNEELETTTEELQSSIEELKTTNEELQSGNVELETINDELRMRSGELDEARAYLHCVLLSVAAAVVVLDAGLNVRSWNSGAEDMWGLQASEVDDQPFFSLDFGLPTAMIRETVAECMASRIPAEPREIVAVNRRGRTIACSISCSPLRDSRKGIVLLMEELRRT